MSKVREWAEARRRADGMQPHNFELDPPGLNNESFFLVPLANGGIRFGGSLKEIPESAVAPLIRWLRENYEDEK